MLKKRGKYFWLACGVAAAALTLLVFYSGRGGPGLSYENKPLDRYWFRQVPFAPGVAGLGMSDRLILPGQRYGPYAESPQATRKAVEAIGTNCLPFLVDKLGRSDSSGYKAIQKWAVKLRMGFVLGRSADAERAQAVMALIWLARQGPFPEEIMRQITALSQSKDAGIAGAAKLVLVWSRPQPAKRTRGN